MGCNKSRPLAQRDALSTNNIASDSQPVSRQAQKDKNFTERKARNSSLRSFNTAPPLKRQMSCNDHLFLLLKQIEKMDRVWERLAEENPADIRKVNDYKFASNRTAGGEIRKDCRQQRVIGEEGDVTNVDELYAAAAAAEPHFRKLKSKLGAEAGGFKIEDGNPAVKARARCESKARGPRYNGAYWKICDILRCSALCKDLKQVLSVLHWAERNGCVEAKNYFRNPAYDGRRFMLLKIRIPFDYKERRVVHMCEVQVVLEEIQDGWNHEHYDHFRTYFAGAGDERDALARERMADMRALVAAQSSGALDELVMNLVSEGVLQKEDAKARLAGLLKNMGRADLARHVDPDNQAQRRDSIKTNLLRVYFSSSGPGNDVGTQAEAVTAEATQTDAEAETNPEGTGMTSGPQGRTGSLRLARSGELASGGIGVDPQAGTGGLALPKLGELTSGGGADMGSADIPATAVTTTAKSTATAKTKRRGTRITDAGPMI